MVNKDLQNPYVRCRIQEADQMSNISRCQYLMRMAI